IKNFSGKTADYIQWKNELEIKFTEMNIDNTLTIFERFSENLDIEYTIQQPDYNSGADLPKAY
ncbi:6633_t:CDS:1, partial [Cetraspora pellucida]